MSSAFAFAVSNECVLRTLVLSGRIPVGFSGGWWGNASFVARELTGVNGCGFVSRGFCPRPFWFWCGRIRGIGVWQDSGLGTRIWREGGDADLGDQAWVFLGLPGFCRKRVGGDYWDDVLTGPGRNALGFIHSNHSAAQLSVGSRLP